MLPPRQGSYALELRSHSVRAAAGGRGEIWKLYFYTGPMPSEGAWPRGMVEMVGVEKKSKGGRIKFGGRK